MSVITHGPNGSLEITNGGSPASFSVAKHGTELRIVIEHPGEVGEGSDVWLRKDEARALRRALNEFLGDDE